jgi:hypothetical protein
MGEGATAAVIRFGTRTGDSSATTTGAATTNQIQDVTSGGFQVGTAAVVNTNAAVYHWATVANYSGLIHTFPNYTGNGTSQTITVSGGLGTVESVWVKGTSSICQRFKAQAGDAALAVDGGNNTGRITSVGTDSFAVGSNSLVNTNAVDYHGVAFVDGATPAQILPSFIDTAEDVYTPTLTGGDNILTPSFIATAEAVYTPTLVLPSTVLVVGAIAVTATYHKLIVELPFTGDSAAVASCPDSPALATTGAILGATTLPIAALPCALPADTVLRFTGNLTATLSSAAASGATSLSVTALDAAIPDGATTWVTGLQFRKQGDTPWRFGLPLTRSSDYGDGYGAAFYGAVLLHDQTPGDTWELRVTLTSTNGVSGVIPVTTTAATRAEYITTHTALLAAAEADAGTRYVNGETGTDAGAGTVAAPYKTLNKAIATVAAGKYIVTEPGSVTPGTTVRSVALGAVNIVARYPAVDDAGQPINEALRTRVEYGTSGRPAVSGPTGSAATDPDIYVAPWVEVTLSGPGFYGTAVGASYSVWKWTGSPVSACTALGYSDTRTGEPKRVPKWQAKGTSMSSAVASPPSGWAELLNTNLSYRESGFFVDPKNLTDIYLVLPSHAPSDDPNDLYITLGKGTALEISAADSRVSGLEFRCFGSEAAGGTITWNATAHRSVTDHCLFRQVYKGPYYKATQGTLGVTPSTYAVDPTAEYNRFEDSNLWTADTTNEKAVHWPLIKLSIKCFNGASYSTNRVTADCESTAIFGRGGALRLVARHSVSEGLFNGVSMGYQDGYDRYAGYGNDFHGWTIRHANDDGLEMDSQNIAVAAWDNRVEESSTFSSISPGLIGPVYLWDNIGWRISNVGSQPAYHSSADTGDPGTNWCKYSGKSTPACRVYGFNNLMWTDQSGMKYVHGPAQATSGATSNERFYLRNNIFRTTGYCASVAGYPSVAAMWDEDYNAWVSEPHGVTVADPAGVVYGMQVSGTRYQSALLTGAGSIAAYRTATGEGAHSNHFDGADISFIDTATVDGWLTDPEAGDVSLLAAATARNAGTFVPNLRDQASQFAGDAPDLGPTEFGAAVIANPGFIGTAEAFYAAVVTNAGGGAIISLAAGGFIEGAEQVYAPDVWGRPWPHRAPHGLALGTLRLGL